MSGVRSRRAREAFIPSQRRNDGVPRSTAWLVLTAAIALVLAAAGLPAAPASAGGSQQSPTLWLTDNTTRRTYNVTLDGQVLSSFEPPLVRSSIAVDPVDRSLWGTSDGMSSLIRNFDRDGDVIGEIQSSDFGGVRNEGIDVTVSLDDASLWLVDDPVDTTTVPTVYNVSRTGQLISSFPTSTFDPASTSPQAIAYDPYSATLWITDNSADRVYNVTLTGTLLSSFDVDNATFGNADNVQGITVESSEVLWITARDTDRVYRVTKDGSHVLSSFHVTVVDPAAGDPTAIAFDRPPGYLGAAAPFALFGLSGAEAKLKDGDKSTGVVGDVGLGPNSTQSFDDGLVAGTLVVDPGARNSNDHDVAISGGVETRGLSLAASDASYASLAASVLAPGQVFGEVKDSLEISGGADLNVIDMKKVELDNEETLTLVGGPSSVFVLNVAEKLKLNHASAIALEGGVSPYNVFINVEGTDEVGIEEGSFVIGTLVAPRAKVKIKGEGSTLIGTLIGGRELKLEDGGRLRALEASLSTGDIGTAASTAVLGLPGSKVKIADSGSNVVGAVGLGPYSKQEFDKGAINGALLVDPLADNSHSHSVTISGGTVAQPLSLAVADAVDGSYALARLTPNVTIPEIKSSITVQAVADITVVASKKIELKDGARLTISGGPSSTFVFNLDEKLKLENGSTVVLTGGVTPDNVFFNLVRSEDASVESGSSVSGTILSPFGKVKVKDAGSVLNGSAIGGDEVVVEKKGSVRHSG